MTKGTFCVGAVQCSALGFEFFCCSVYHSLISHLRHLNNARQKRVGENETIWWAPCLCVTLTSITFSHFQNCQQAHSSLLRHTYSFYAASWSNMRKPATCSGILKPTLFRKVVWGISTSRNWHTEFLSSSPSDFEQISTEPVNALYLYCRIFPSHFGLLRWRDVTEFLI